MRNISYLLCLFWFFGTAAEACELTMGYKDTGKGVLIGPMGNDSGAYRDLFIEAAHRIDCDLKIVRYPKARLHKMLEAGTVDFYPGVSFSRRRADYLHYMPNGFRTTEIGVSRSDLAVITDVQDPGQMTGVTVLGEVGTSKSRLVQYGADLSEVLALSFDRVVALLTRQRADFYIGDTEYYRPYLASRGLDRLEELGLKGHPDCCGGEQPMFLGFSQSSPNFSGLRNAAFDPNRPVSPQNQRVLVSSDSIAGRLGNALAAMASEGLSQRIYARQGVSMLN